MFSLLWFLQFFKLAYNVMIDNINNVLCLVKTQKIKTTSLPLFSYYCITGSYRCCIKSCWKSKKSIKCLLEIVFWFFDNLMCWNFENGKKCDFHWIKDLFNKPQIQQIVHNGKNVCWKIWMVKSTKKCNINNN